MRRLGAICAALLLVSCANGVKNEQRDASFQRQLKSVAVVWRAPDVAAMTGRGTGDRLAGMSNQDNTRTIANLLRDGLRADMPRAFNARGICVASPGSADAQLSMIPTEARTNCSRAGCVTTVDVKVGLIPKGTTREVWSAVFEATLFTQQAEVSPTYYNAVADKLAGNGLLQGGSCDAP